MADIVERLRGWAKENAFFRRGEDANATSFICKEAADEIERLREENKKLVLFTGGDMGVQHATAEAFQRGYETAVQELRKAVIDDMRKWYGCNMSICAGRPFGRCLDTYEKERLK